MSASKPFLGVLLLLRLASDARAALAAQEPAAVGTWMNQGQRSLEERRFVDAMDSFLKVIEVAPENAEAQRRLLEVSREMSRWEQEGKLKPGEIEQAHAAALKEIRAQRERADRLNAELAAARDSLKNKSEKVLLTVFTSLTRTSEDEVLDANMMAQARTYLEQAQGRLRTSLRRGDIRDPKDLHITKGFLYYHRGLLDSALEEWQAALALDPADEPLKKQVGWLGGKVKKARDREMIVKLSGEAAAHFKSENYGKSIEAWTLALALNPQNEKAIAGLAEAQAKLKEKAMNEHLSQARRLVTQHEPLEALRHWVGVLEADPTNTEALQAVRAWKNVAAPAASASAAAVLSETAKTSPVAARAQRPRELRPEQAEEQYAMGMAYYAQGDTALALDAMRKALDLNSGLRKAQIAVERIRAESGQ